MANIVLSYHDSLIRRCDLKLLDGCNWINDSIISFYLQYLEHEIFSEYASQVCFISPEVTQFIKLSNSDEELSIFLSPLNLPERNFVFMPVNDSSDPENPGGCHWSLLLYNRIKNQFEHYDSMSGSNTSCAKHVMKKVTSYVNANANLKLVNIDCLQQCNSYDCGIHVLINCEQLSNLYLLFDHSSSINLDDVRKKRTKIKDLILSLAQNS